jgi:hypothetical protein
MVEICVDVDFEGCPYSVKDGDRGKAEICKMCRDLAGLRNNIAG